MTLQIIDGLSNKDYHASPALGSTSLKTLATKTPAHYRWQADHPVHKDVFDLGTVAHSLILEGDTTGVEVLDYPAFTTKAAREARDEARNNGKIPLLEKDWRGVTAMHDAVMAHPMARAALTGHVAERSIFWEHESGIDLKTRPDALHTGGPLGNLIVDLKTTASADPNEFGRSAANLGYHIQQAHYQAGLKAAYGEDFSFVFLLVEKSLPHLVSVVEIHSEDVTRGADLVERGIHIYNHCCNTGEWPGYESVEPIELPRWARYQEEEWLDVRV